MSRTVSSLVISVALFLGLQPNSNVANAVTVDILLHTNPPPISPELRAYMIPCCNTIFVGFGGADIGEGVGDGHNDRVPFSFEFPPFLEVHSATLTLDLAPGDALVTTDFLAFADNNSQRLAEMYGNEQLYALPLGVRTTVTFDLRNVPGQYGSGLHYDLSALMLDGDLDVIYDDDATVYSARLQISGTMAPVPTQDCAEATEGAVANLQCPGGFVSRVVFASYGTPSPCPLPAIGSCHAGSSLQITEALCLNRFGGCSVPATNDVFGDPCPLIGKRLVVVYECHGIIDTPVCVEEGENEILRLECPSGTVISAVNFASYGTPTSCPEPSLGPCHSSVSRPVVENACLGRQSCSLLASNEFFGDPCVGVPKRLVVSYTCSGVVAIRPATWTEAKVLYR